MRIKTLLALLLFMSLAACGGSDDSSDTNDPSVDIPPDAPADPASANIIVDQSSENVDRYVFTAVASADQVNEWDFSWRVLNTSGGVLESFADVEEIEYLFTQAGSYFVELTVIDLDGQQAVDTVEVIASGGNVAPVADVLVSGEGFARTFDARGSVDSNGDSLSYTWEIADVITLDGALVSYEFTGPGQYSVTLTVSDGVASDVEVFFVSVGAPQGENMPPVADFSIEISGLSVVTSAALSVDPDGSIVQYIWDFNGDAVRTGENASHTFATGGSKQVTLTVVDNSGVSDALTQDIVVSNADLSNNPPVAEFSFAVDGLVVNFVSMSVDPDNDNLTYDWDFGDGLTSQEKDPSHSYATSGDYVVSLTVSDGQLSNTASLPVSISADNTAPTAEFSYSIDDLRVAFSSNAADADGDNLTYSWSFGDGNTSSEDNPNHTYLAAGSYMVTLLVSDGNLTDTETQSITLAETPVDQNPVARFEVTAQNDLSVTVDASGSSDPEDDIADLTYSWDFDGEATRTGLVVTYEFASEGDKVITLTVTDSADNQDTASERVTVSAPAVDLLTYVVENVIGGDINCAQCHASGGIASGTGFVFSAQTNEAVETAMLNFIEASYPANVQVLKDKPNAIPSHLGGDKFNGFPEAQQRWEALVDQLAATLAPVTEIEANFTYTVEEFVVSVDASSTTEGSDADHTYAWSVNNGLTANGQNADLDLVEAGTYIITLTVTDTSDNRSDSIEQTVTLEDDDTPVAGNCAQGISQCFDFESGLPDAFVGQDNGDRVIDTSTGYNSESSVRFTTTAYNDAQFFNLPVPAADFWARVFVKSSGDQGQYASTWGGDQQGFTRPHGTLIRGRDGSAQMRIGDHRCQLEINRDQGPGHLGDDLEMTSGSYGDNDSVCQETFGARMQPETWYCLEVHFNGPESEIQVFWDNQNVEQLHVTEERTWTNADKAPGGPYSQNSDQPWGPYDFDTFEFGYENYQGSGPVQPDGQQPKPTVTYWYDDVAVHTERVGCGDDYVQNAPLDASTRLGPDDNGYPYDDGSGEVDDPAPSPSPSPDPIDVGQGTIIFSEDFESYDVNSYPSEWGYFVNYQTDIFDTSVVEAAIRVTDTDVNSGSRALQMINRASDTSPVQITRVMDTDLYEDRVFLRLYMKQSIDLGRTRDNNHATLFGLRGATGSSNTEVRFGDAKGVLGINIMPTDGISPVYEKQANQLSAEELAAAPLIARDEWHCLEIAFLDDGEQSQVYAWNDGEQIFALESLDDFAPGGPTEPHWLAEQFHEVMIGWQSWLGGSADAVNENIWVDDIVASTERIGCL